jgi:hypothetical protein
VVLIAGGFWGAIALIVITYLVAAEIAKRYFYRAYHLD